MSDLLKAFVTILIITVVIILLLPWMGWGIHEYFMWVRSVLK